jgi:integrase
MLAEIARYDEERAKAPGRGGRIVAQRSGETVDKARRTLRSALSAAVRDDMITVNPAQGRFDEIPARGQGETVMWQPDDVRKFLAHIADDPLAALWTVAAFTGLRRGELCGLRWADVDLEAEVPGIVIRQTVVAVPGSNPCPVCEVLHRGRIIQGSAKSTAGVRWVPLTSDSTSELLAHQIKQETHRADVGELYVNHGLVFAMASGEPLRPDAVTKRHGVLVAQAGLPQIKLHAMRHGAVSMLAAAGLTDELIALIVGHSSAQVTRDVYLHGIRGQLGDAAEAAAKLVRGDTP